MHDWFSESIHLPISENVFGKLYRETYVRFSTRVHGEIFRGFSKILKDILVITQMFEKNCEV